MSIAVTIIKYKNKIDLKIHNLFLTLKLTEIIIKLVNELNIWFKSHPPYDMTEGRYFVVSK